MESRCLQKFELHYFFSDDSHSMDALVRNDCERELLALFKECSEILGIKCNVESEAFSEGGLKEVWNFLGTPQVALVVAVLALVMSRYPPTDSERNAADEKLLELQTEEARLNIEKLKLELKKLKEDKENQEALEIISDEVVKSSKVLVRRSNFYEKAIRYEKISNVSYTHLNFENIPVSPSINIDRDAFRFFIIYSKALKPINIEDAEIEIVSPVLKAGNYKWKGIYEDEVITFAMSDGDFRYQVQSKQVAFQNGSTITCVLEIQRKLDETGEIVITGYAVTTVIGKYDSTQSLQTPQGKAYKQAKKYAESQQDLFGK